VKVVHQWQANTEASGVKGASFLVRVIGSRCISCSSRVAKAFSM
jgi:hypothetical protein